MTCNCNRDGDIEYTITLNQQGPQGRQGNVGQDGFSPIVSVYSSTEANYQLKIISGDGEIITPNLKGQDGTVPSGVALVGSNNQFFGTNTFAGKTYLNGTAYTTSLIMDSISSETELVLANIDGVLKVDNKAIITEVELDELADDVVDINSQLAGLSLRKYTEEEYASIATPDDNTLYMVTNSDGNTFKLYLGSIELEGGGGGTVISGDNASQKTYIENVDATVSATKVE